MKKLLVLLMLCAASVTYASTDVYINANAGTSTVDSYDLAYNANAGYMFNDYFAIEGGYTWNQGNNFWDAAVKGILPIPIVDIYGKAGWAFVDGDNYNNTGALLYGVGIAFPIFPYFKINVEDYAISSYNTQNFVMAGLQFNF
jgi:hypothetical protein